MTDSLFVLKTDFDMVTYELRDKTEFLAQNIMRLILDFDLMKRDMIEVKLVQAEHSQELKQIKADMRKMDAKLDLIIKHFKI